MNFEKRGQHLGIIDDLSELNILDKFKYVINKDNFNQKALRADLKTFIVEEARNTYLRRSQELEKVKHTVKGVIREESFKEPTKWTLNRHCKNIIEKLVNK